MNIKEESKKRKVRVLNILLPFIGSLLGVMVGVVGLYLTFSSQKLDKTLVMKQFVDGLTGNYDEQRHAIISIATCLGYESAIEIEPGFRTGATIRALEKLKEGAPPEIKKRIKEMLSSVSNVILIDSDDPQNIYSPFTEKSGGTNADDIIVELRMFPVRFTGRIIGKEWNDSDTEEVINQKPDLIIMHVGSFEFVKGNRGQAREIADFVHQVAGKLGTTQFLVYSRLESSILEAKELILEERLSDRLFTLHVERGDFTQPESARSLRTVVARALELDPLYYRDWRSLNTTSQRE